MLLFLISANVSQFDFDLWARLVAGMGVIDGHQVLKTDMLSYIPTHTWWDHEYGSGIVFYFFLKHFGAYSLIYLQTAICFLITFFITRIIKLRGIKAPYNFIFWLFPVIAIAENFGNPIRCHLFSFLFFTVFLYILELVRRGNTKLIYILPIITIIWNNLHGGVVSGLGLIAIFGIGEILERKPFKHYIISGILSFAALIINPWGWEYIKFLLMANLMPRPDVAEWWSIFSKHQLNNQIPFKIMLVLAIGLEVVSFMKNYKFTHNIKTIWQNSDKTKLILLVLTLYLAIAHVKLLPFFVIITAAYCYEDFQKYIEQKLPLWTKTFSAILVFIVSVYAITIKDFSVPVGADSYPHREVEFIKQNNLLGKVLVNFGHGSFVAYKLYPHNQIYMDGRYEEVFYNNELEMLKNFYLLKPNWEELLIKYPPDVMIIEKTYPVYTALNKHPDWRNVYETELFIVYVRTKDIKPKYIQPTDNYDYYKNTLFDTDIKF